MNPDQATSPSTVENHANDASTQPQTEATPSIQNPSSSQEVTADTQAEQPLNQESPNNNLESSSGESFDKDSAYRGRKDRNWNNKRSMGKRRNYKDERYPNRGDASAPQISDPTLWPTLEQAVNTKTDTPTKDSNPLLSSKGSAESSDEKQTSPRNEKNEDLAAKKKGIDWVPLKMPGPLPTRRPRDRDRNNRRKEGERSASPSPASRSPSSPPKEPSDSNSQNYGRGYRSSSRGGKRGFGRGGFGGNSQWPYYYPTVVLEEDAYNQALLAQIEYYFSVENLCRDLYLRNLMDKEGWVPLSTITNFNRVKAFQPENPRLLEVVKTSTILELNDNKVRRKEDWKHWILPKDESKATESTSVPSTTTTTTTSTVAVSTTNNGSNPEKKLTFGDIAAMSAPQPKAKPVAPAPQQPASKPKPAPSQPAHEEKKAHPHAHPHSAPKHNEEKEEKPSKKSEEDEWTTVSSFKKKKNRNFSGNSSKKAEVHEEKPVSASTVTPNHVAPASSLPEPEEKLAEVPDPVPVGDFDESTLDQLVIVTEIFSKTPVNVSNPNALVAHFPTVIRASKTKKNTLEKFTTSVGWTLKDSKMNLSELETIGQFRYGKYREISMEKRKKLGVGKGEDMNTLYKFWSYFLRTHFNNVMYEDFKTCAVEDAKKNSRFGLDLLFQFFSFGLEIKYRDQLFNDFQELVLQDHLEGSPSGLEKFNAYLRYKKDNVTLDIKPDLAKLLEKQKQDQKNAKKDSK